MPRQPEVREFGITEVENESGPWVGRDLYELNTSVKGWRHQLQRLCFWVLGKIQGRALHPPITYKTVRTPIVDQDGSVLKRLERKLIRHLAEPIWFGEVKTILVGPDTFHELMGERAAFDDQWISLDYAPLLGRSGAPGKSEVKFMGIDLHVIPTMEGMLVLPGKIMVDGRYTEDDRAANGLATGTPYRFNDKKCAPI